MHLEISTPALLFPAVSLLFLAYTNRFLHLSSLIRLLHRDWLETNTCDALAQINNLRQRLVFIRLMQLSGAISLLICVISMLGVLSNLNKLAVTSFAVALVAMAISLGLLIYEIYISGGALQVLLTSIEGSKDSSKPTPAEEPAQTVLALSTEK